MAVFISESKNGNNGPVRFLRLKEVQNRVGVSRSTIYLWIEKGAFPKPIKISPRLIAWPEQTISAWMIAKIDRSNEES